MKTKRKFTRPRTQFGQQLLNSIPRKVHLMLLQAGIKMKINGDLPVTWNLSSKHIMLQKSDGGFETITWCGPNHNPTDTRLIESADTKWIENVELCMNRFVELEKTIYGAVEHYIENAQG